MQIDVFNTAIIAALFGLLGTVLGGVLKLRIERKKQEGTLILEALKTRGSERVAGNLVFLSEAGLIRLSREQVRVLKVARGLSIVPGLPPLERFEAIPSSALTPDLDAMYNTLLRSFQDYLRRSGFKIQVGGVTRFSIVPGDVVNIDNQSFFSVYVPDTNIMQVASKYAYDTDLILHEYMRHVLLPSATSVPNPVENAAWWTYFAIDSGLAVYYPCSFNQRPVFGTSEEISTSLDNEIKFNEPPHDQYSAHNEGNKAWGGAFWEIRGLLGQSVADKLLCTAWMSWCPSDANRLRANFISRLIEVHRAENGEHLAEIMPIFERRNLKL